MSAASGMANLQWPDVIQAFMAVAVFVWALVQADNEGRLRRGRACAQVAAAIALVQAAERALDAFDLQPQAQKLVAKTIVERGYLGRSKDGLSQLSLPDFPTAMAITNLLHAQTALTIILLDVAKVASSGTRPVSLATSVGALKKSRESLEWQLQRLKSPFRTKLSDLLYATLKVGRAPPEA